MRNNFNLMLLSTAALFLGVATASADDTRYSANPPSSILTPNSTETGVGTLKFNDGAPDEATVKLAYDQLDLAYGIQAFMKGMPATSVYSACRGVASIGVTENAAFGMTEEMMDARSLFLTPNTTTPYVFACLNLSAGPVVMEVPPAVLGPVDDAYFRWVTDVGFTGPDQGRGGRYLFLPPGYAGEVPIQGFHVVRATTNRNLIFFRAFVKEGDLKGAVDNVKTNAKLYPLSAMANPPPTNSSTRLASSSTPSAATRSSSTMNSTRWCRASQRISWSPRRLVFSRQSAFERASPLPRTSA